MTSPLPTDAEKLGAEWRAAMEGVTPGTWRSTGGYLTVRDPDGPSFTASIYSLDEMGQKTASAPFQAVPFARQQDASWIARCSPSAISGLLDRLEAAEARVTALEAEKAKAEERALRLAKEQRALWDALIPKGPRCRDCADFDGRCQGDGPPCDPHAHALEIIAKLKARASLSSTEKTDV